MKDAMGSAVLGGTKWKRFALVMVPTVAIAGAMTVMMAEGALATSIDLSGQAFQVGAKTLHGTDFEQTGAVVKGSDGVPHAVAVAGIAHADITDMCQSVKVSIPVIGTMVIKLTAGDNGTPASADNLVLDASQINASNAVFTGVSIGVDAGQLNGVQGFNGVAGAFGQVVNDAVLTDVQQTAYSTTAGTLTLNHLGISANFNGSTCF